MPEIQKLTLTRTDESVEVEIDGEQNDLVDMLAFAMLQDEGLYGIVLTAVFRTSAEAGITTGNLMAGYQMIQKARNDKG